MSQSRFHSTRWSLVIAAANDDNRQRSGRALNELLSIYWHPLYAYLRRSGYCEADAEDLTQGFVQQLLERNSLA